MNFLESPLFYLSLQSLIIPAVIYFFKKIHETSHDLAVVKNDISWIKNKLNGKPF
jgi:hypothetical protein